MLASAFWGWKINSVPLSTVSDLSVPLVEQTPKVENPEVEKTPVTARKITESQNDVHVNFKIDEQSFSLNVPRESSLYEALVLAEKAQLTTFSGKEYPSLGFFVGDIGELHGGDGNYLIYYVNGKEASVGVSAYKLKDGDTIEWKLE